MAKGNYTIGIDLGGTKAAAALVDHKGRLVSESVRPTVPPSLKDQDPRAASREPSASDVRKHIEYLIQAMADAVIEAAEPLTRGKGAKSLSAQLSGVGLASAGPMDIGKGTLNHPANFRGWKVVPLVQLLKEALAERGLRKPIFFQNDAIAAALGEGWTGRATGCSTYAMITVGTGIGSGVIFNGKPAQSRGMGSEWGHMLAHAPGLSKDRERLYERTVEGIASGTGLARRAASRGLKQRTAAELAEAARRRDRKALEIFAEASEALASLFFTLSLGFRPEKFVVSGGMLAIKDLFLPQAIELYRDLMKREYPNFLAPVQVAKLGTKAGVIGAARLPYLDE